MHTPHAWLAAPAAELLRCWASRESPSAAVVLSCDEEIGRTILADAAALGRYEPEGTLTAVAAGQMKRSMCRLRDSSAPIEPRCSYSITQGFDPVAVVAGDDTYAGALGERWHDLAREA
jgi:hypothetical protein